MMMLVARQASAMTTHPISSHGVSALCHVIGRSMTPSPMRIEFSHPDWVKMMTHTQLKAWLGEHFNLYLLAAVLLILAAGVVASLVVNRRDGQGAAGESAGGAGPSAASMSSLSSER